MEERSPRRYGEVFTQVNREGQQRFIAALQGLREAPTCTLLLGLRVDFYGELMNSALWPVADGERVEIAPLLCAALREAIREPAEDQGVHLEVGLLDQLMQDAAQEPGVLPLLQETMRALWTQLDRRLLTVKAYEALGSEGRGSRWRWR